MLDAPAASLAEPAARLAPERHPVGGWAPAYRCYDCADGRYVSVGPREPQFWAGLLERVGAPRELREQQNAPANWSDRVALLDEQFKPRSRDETPALLETDACFAPVLRYQEYMAHPQMSDSYIEVGDLEHEARVPLLPNVTRRRF